MLYIVFRYNDDFSTITDVIVVTVSTFTQRITVVRLFHHRPTSTTGLLPPQAYFHHRPTSTTGLLPPQAYFTQYFVLGFFPMIMNGRDVLQGKR